MTSRGAASVKKGARCNCCLMQHVRVGSLFLAMDRSDRLLLVAPLSSAALPASAFGGPTGTKHLGAGELEVRGQLKQPEQLCDVPLQVVQTHVAAELTRLDDPSCPATAAQLGVTGSIVSCPVEEDPVARCQRMAVVQ